MVIYPTLVVIVHENDLAKEVLSKDFDVQVSRLYIIIACKLLLSRFLFIIHYATQLLDEFKGSELAKKSKLVSLVLNGPPKTESKPESLICSTASSSVASSTPPSP